MADETAVPAEPPVVPAADPPTANPAVPAVDPVVADQPTKPGVDPALANPSPPAADPASLPAPAPIAAPGSLSTVVEPVPGGETTYAKQELEGDMPGFVSIGLVDGIVVLRMSAPELHFGREEALSLQRLVTHVGAQL